MGAGDGGLRRLQQQLQDTTKTYKVLSTKIVTRKSLEKNADEERPDSRLFHSTKLASHDRRPRDVPYYIINGGDMRLTNEQYNSLFGLSRNAMKDETYRW